MRSLNRGRASLPSSNSNHHVRAFGAGLFMLALAGGLISAQSRPTQARAVLVLQIRSPAVWAEHRAARQRRVALEALAAQ